METAIVIAACIAIGVTSFTAGWQTQKYHRNRMLEEAFNDGYVAGALAKSKYEATFDEMEPRIVEPYFTHDETEAETK